MTQAPRASLVSRLVQRYTRSWHRWRESRAVASESRVIVAARHLGTDGRYGVGADVRAPMASTVKLPLAVAVLADVDTGRLSLDAVVPIDATMLLSGDGSLDALRAMPDALPTTRTVGELLRMALAESDNTAADRLFAMVGGPAVVHAAVARAGVVGMRIDRDISTLMADRPRAHVAAAGSLAAAGRVFLADPRDTTTPAAMVELLALVQTGRLLSADSTSRVLASMRACRTSPGRMRAAVPAGAEVAHKTGTLLGAVVADVGLVTLRRGEVVALAAYVTGPIARASSADAMIAKATRTAIAAVS